MHKIFYYTIGSYLIDGKPCYLRLVVERGDMETVEDYYFEYGHEDGVDTTMSEGAWSMDPEQLIGEMPSRYHFQASMDLRHFIRTDLEDALDGSLMADAFDILI